MIKEDSVEIQERTKEVPFVCPVCRGNNKISIPINIINRSKQLTTVSIPAGLICEHSFQAFIDKNFKVRGYQKVDYELSSMEYLEGGGAGLLSPCAVGEGKGQPWEYRVRLHNKEF